MKNSLVLKSMKQPRTYFIDASKPTLRTILKSLKSGIFPLMSILCLFKHCARYWTPSLACKVNKLWHQEMKIYKDNLMKLFSNLQECGLLEDRQEEGKTTKRIKKNLTPSGELFQKLDIQKEAQYSIISGKLKTTSLSGTIGNNQYQLINMMKMSVSLKFMYKLCLPKDLII